jgi:hypothetical protein
MSALTRGWRRRSRVQRLLLLLAVLALLIAAVAARSQETRMHVASPPPETTLPFAASSSHASPAAQLSSTSPPTSAVPSELRVWGTPNDSPLRIVTVSYDPPGDDTKNLYEEYVTFIVLVSGSLLGYSVEDESGHRYRFPDQIRTKGDLITLHSGQGQDTKTDLYWGVSGAAIWDNEGGTVKVLDPRGQIVATYSYDDR